MTKDKAILLFQRMINHKGIWFIFLAIFWYFLIEIALDLLRREDLNYPRTSTFFLTFSQSFGLLIFILLAIFFTLK